VTGETAGQVRRSVWRATDVRLAAVALGLMIAVALFATVIAPFHPAEQFDLVRMKNLPPSLAHPFGTDGVARDVLSRVIHGTRASLGVAGIAVLVALIAGTAVGAIAGFVGGRTDRWMMRIVDALLAIPRILILLVIAAALGRLPISGLALVIGLTGWPGMSRLVRAQVREIAALDYVLAAHALGVRPVDILLRHILPATLPQILVASTLAVASVIPLEAGLSFLGIGIPVPQPSWGNILLEAYEQNLAQWWLVLFPGLAIITTVLAVNVIGEKLRESFDPRLRPPV
jgi:peptide/nickel transport system permease protein